MEQWKTIKDFKGYEVSNTGKVRSKTRRVKFKNATTLKHGNEISQRSNSKVGKYLVVELCKNGKRYYRTVHRLVAIAFIDNPLNKPEVNHKDGDKNNCHYTNLQWMTRSENQQHAYDNGLQPKKKGEKSHFAKLTNEDAENIRQEYINGGSYGGGIGINELSNGYGVSEATIRRIIKRQTYSD